MSLTSRILSDLPCPITSLRSPFAFGVATMWSATPCVRIARAAVVANAIVAQLADSALLAHKWPPPGGVNKRQTPEGQLTVIVNPGTGAVPPRHASSISVSSQPLARLRLRQNLYRGAPFVAAPAAGIIPSIRCLGEDLNPGEPGLG